MSKALRFQQITAEHQDSSFFIVFFNHKKFILHIKTSSQNISITLSQISLKLHEHRGRSIGGKSSRERLWKKSS